MTHLLPFSHLSDDEVLLELEGVKGRLRHQVTILGHHYQHDDIIRYVDALGDSLQLSLMAKDLAKPHIVFCGVTFMAETADILTQDYQKVHLPDLRAGCSMADMASMEEVWKAWHFLKTIHPNLIPITYINCSAELKAFVGEEGGSICTSSNAKKIIQWGLEKSGGKLFFFPDQHLGRNTCYSLGIPLEQMCLYNPRMPQGGLSLDQCKEASIFLWHGFCSVHQGFKVEHVKEWRERSPQTQIVVHPECSFEVVQMANHVGSTSFIMEHLKNTQEPSSFAIGTEINLVHRLKKHFPQHEIYSLSPYQCLCTTMYRIRPRWLLETLMAIETGNHNHHIIQVPSVTKFKALVALERMFLQ